MGRKRKVSPIEEEVATDLARSPEMRESELTNLAMLRARQQIIDGTASSQLLVHFLKLGSSRERLEVEKLEKEVEKLKAQTLALKSQVQTDELYKNALKAMSSYAMPSLEEEYYDEEEL